MVRYAAVRGGTDDVSEYISEECEAATPEEARLKMADALDYRDARLFVQVDIAMPWDLPRSDHDDLVAKSRAINRTMF